MPLTTAPVAPVQPGITTAKCVQNGAASVHEATPAEDVDKGTEQLHVAADPPLPATRFALEHAAVVHAPAPSPTAHLSTAPAASAAAPAPDSGKRSDTPAGVATSKPASPAVDMCTATTSLATPTDVDGTA